MGVILDNGTHGYRVLSSSFPYFLILEQPRPGGLDSGGGSKWGVGEGSEGVSGRGRGRGNGPAGGPGALAVSLLDIFL